MRELIVDSFAGGGGASTGIEAALGISPGFAVNHDAVALSMHRANHPKTAHLPHSTVRVCTRCDLRKITRHEFEGGREVHWTEFWRGTDRVRGEGTPACEPAEAEVA